jgi:anti-sigma regulatory factor (Ser/Thr protein kinase)
MHKLILTAKIENLNKVFDFLDAQLSSLAYNMKAKLQLELSIEEAYVNISKYAYTSDKGEVEILSSVDEDPLQITVQFVDSGIPYNPLKTEDPDLCTDTEEKELGGLGIFLIKKNVDNIKYKYHNGKNILTLQKKLDD